MIKEALQQFHGEIEYDKILNRVNFFAAGNLDDTVKKELRSVVREIIPSVGGPTKIRLERIVKSTMSKGGGKKATAKKSTTKKTTTIKTTTKKASAKKTKSSKSKK